MSPEGGLLLNRLAGRGRGGGHRIQTPSDRGGHRIQAPSDRGGHRIRTPSDRGGHRIRTDTLPLISDPPRGIIKERPLTLVIFTCRQISDHGPTGGRILSSPL